MSPKEVGKMRRTIAVAAVFAFMVLSVTSLYALPEPISKLKGGVVDIIKAPLDLGKYTYDETKGSSFMPLGFLRGLMIGTAHTIDKAARGAVDIATFPVNLKK